MIPPILKTCLACRFTSQRRKIKRLSLVFLLCTASLLLSSAQLQATPIRPAYVAMTPLRSASQRPLTSATPLVCLVRLDKAIDQDTVPTTPAGIGILALLLALLGWARGHRKP